MIARLFRRRSRNKAWIIRTKIRRVPVNGRKEEEEEEAPLTYLPLSLCCSLSLLLSLSYNRRWQRTKERRQNKQDERRTTRRYVRKERQGRRRTTCRHATSSHREGQGRRTGDEVQDSEGDERLGLFVALSPETEKVPQRVPHSNVTLRLKEERKTS